LPDVEAEHHRFLDEVVRKQESDASFTATITDLIEMLF
jgi:hypothetical protein